MAFHQRLLLIGLFFGRFTAGAQEDSLGSAPLISRDYIAAIEKKATSLERRLNKLSDVLIADIIRYEKKLQRKIARKDSTAANRLTGSVGKTDILPSTMPAASQAYYLPSLDTIDNALRLLADQPRLIALPATSPADLTKAMEQVQRLKTQFARADALQKVLRQKKQYLKTQLEQFGMLRELKKFNQQAYYYGARLNECKQLLNDPSKAEQKALAVLRQTKLFQTFLQKNSLLASLFRLPDDPMDPAAQANLAGLQTRAQVMSQLQQQITVAGSGGQASFSQQVQQAQKQLNALKNRLNGSGSGRDDEGDLPDNFKPNHQRTRRFLQRLEWGANIQSQRATAFWPVTSDLGFSLGYKLSDEATVGVGGSYKLGWGKTIRQLSVTHEGLGLRAYFEHKLKGSFWIAGGYEMNYRARFRRFADLENREGWQQSGLVGLSKVISLRSTMFKKTKAQLLWDWLSYRQLPVTPPILFRIHYTF